MRKQKQIWLAEHSDKTTLPTMANTRPASGVILFVEFLKQQGQKIGGTAVDIGSGKGRNSVYLASLGYEVYAMEYIQPAITAAKALAKSRGVSDNIHFANAEIDATAFTLRRWVTKSMPWNISSRQLLPLRRWPKVAAFQTIFTSLTRKLTQRGNMMTIFSI